MNYYKIACKYATPLFRTLFNYKVIGGENLLRAAARGGVVVCTTHSSDLGGMIVGMAVSTILKTEPWIVINAKFRKHVLINFFLKDMNIVWIMSNDMLGNYGALRRIRDLLVRRNTEVIIIAPQGTYNKPIPGEIKFREGFAIPCIQAARSGAIVNVVPAIDVSATYKGIPAVGRRIAAVFGYPMTVKKHAERTSLTSAVEKSVKELMAAYGILFWACYLAARIYVHCQ